VRRVQIRDSTVVCSPLRHECQRGSRARLSLADTWQAPQHRTVGKVPLIPRFFVGTCRDPVLPRHGRMQVF